MQLVSRDVATICAGMAASMGAVLLTAGAAGKRYAPPHSRVMIHQPLGGRRGQASDIEITARQIAQTKKELYEILSHHSGTPVKRSLPTPTATIGSHRSKPSTTDSIDEVLSKRVNQNE